MEEIVARLLNIEDFGQFPNVSVMELEKLPRCTAIYFLYFPEDPNRSIKGLSYIGRAKCLRSRWKQKGGHGLLFARQRIAWVEVSVDVLNEVEKRLISVYQPPLNIVHAPRNHRRNWKR